MEEDGEGGKPHGGWTYLRWVVIATALTKVFKIRLKYSLLSQRGNHIKKWL